MTKTVIAWDLGATKCAAGLIEYQTTDQHYDLKKRCAIKLTEADSLENLVELVEATLGISMSDADAICIGAAGCYDGEQLILVEGYPYAMPFAAIAKKRNWPKYEIVHDYAPIVCATFTSYMQEPQNVRRLNQCEINPYARRVALGIGTGLGLKDGVLLPSGEFWLGHNEMGHIGINFPPEMDAFWLQRHSELMRFLSAQYNQPITFEKILSGRGTARLHQFFYPDVSHITPEEVGENMRNGKADEMLAAFSWYLGLFIGTVQLSFMPEGGVWVTGGVALQHPEAFDQIDFWHGIHSSPAYLEQRKHYPLGVLCNQDHALYGGAFFAARRLLK